MNKGKAAGKAIEKFRKLKRLKLLLSFLGPVSLFVLCLLVVMVAVIVVYERMLPVFTTASMTGVETIYDDTHLVNDLNTSIEDWKDDENYLFYELKRQKNIWVNDYIDYGVVHNPGNPYLVIDEFQTNDLDLVELIVPIQHQGAVNLYSFDQDFSKVEEVIKPDGTLNTDYESEVIVFNSDTRDFYKQAGERIGNTFFFYPGQREMLGNLIGAEITFDAIRPVYVLNRSCEVHVPNLPLILADWHVIGKMSLKDDAMYEAYLNYELGEVHGPYSSAGDFVNAFGDGYDYCLGKYATNDKEDWSWLNICNDYDLLLEETEYIDDKYNRLDSNAELESIIREGASATSLLKEAILPKWETNKNGYLVEQNIIDYEFINTLKYADGTCPETTVTHPTLAFITSTVDRFEDKDLFEKYMKELYIPYVYPWYEVDDIWLQMQQIEQVYRYYNHEGYMELGGEVVDPGSSIIGGNNFQCGNTPVYVSDEYCSDGNCRSHNAADVTTSVKHPNIRPILAGKVYSVHSSCPNSPTCSVSDAMKYIGGTSLSSLSSACQCGGGLGNNVVIESVYNGKTYYTVYAHLSAVNVTIGDEVTTDTIIGVMGTTGVSTGDHLHIEMHEGNRWNSKFSPTQLFSSGQIGNSVCDNKVEDDDEKEV